MSGRSDDEPTAQSQLSEIEIDQLFDAAVKLKIGQPNVQKAKLESSLEQINTCIDGPLIGKALSLLIEIGTLEDSTLSPKALAVLESNEERLKKILNTDDTIVPTTLDAVETLIKFGNLQQQEKARAIMKEGVLRLSQRLDDPKITAHAIDYIMQFGDKDAKDLARKKLVEVIRAQSVLTREPHRDYINGQELADNPLFSLLGTKKNETFLEVWGAVDKHLKEFGLGGYEMIGYWMESSDPHDHNQVIIFNLANINDLEKRKNGGAKELHTKQNIINFGRYPIEFLMDQFSAEGDDRRNGFLSVSMTDNNGAFYDLNTYMIYKALHQKLKKKYKIEIVEISPNRETISRQMNPRNEVETDDFAIIEVHGEKGTLGYGTRDVPLIISGADIRDDKDHLGLKRIKKGGVILLLSCESGVASSGEEVDGIAKEVSELTQTTTIAPEKAAGTRSVEITTTNEGLLKSLKPSFEKGRFDNTPVKANTFICGKLQE